MLRFLPGIILLQLISIILFWVNTESSFEWSPTLALKVLAPLLLMSIVAALWFDSIGRHRASDAIAKLRESHAREREKLQVKTEKEKTRIMKDAHKEISRQTRRVSGRANIKVGLAFLGAAGAGLIMLITELVTFGMMTLMTAGGALGGYLTRAKQDRPLTDARDDLHEAGREPRIINDSGTSELVPEPPKPPQ